MEYKRQKRILNKSLNQARKLFNEEIVRAKGNPSKQMKACFIYLEKLYAFQVDIIRVRALKYEPRTDTERERINQHTNKLVVRQYKRELKERLAYLKKVITAEEYAEVIKRIKEGRRQQRAARKALKLEAQQSRDNENEASTNLGQLGNTSREENMMKHHPVLLRSKI